MTSSLRSGGAASAATAMAGEDEEPGGGPAAAAEPVKAPQERDTTERILRDIPKRPPPTVCDHQYTGKIQSFC